MKIVNEKEARKSILEEAEKMNNSDFDNAWQSKDKSIKKPPRNSFFKRFLVDFKDIFLMFKDYLIGRYREIPFWIIIAIAGVLVYVINPLDLVPDVVPILGLIDDALIIYLCILMVRLDLNKYRKWKNETKK
jgi:uncharacterized membrane protein YkvA (DUF1232 family)